MSALLCGPDLPESLQDGGAGALIAGRSWTGGFDPALRSLHGRALIFEQRLVAPFQRMSSPACEVQAKI